MTSSELIYGGIACLVILLWLVYRYGLFVPAPKGLPILLYHKVAADRADTLTISTDCLDRELAYIKSSGYTPISFCGTQGIARRPPLLSRETDHCDF